MFLADRPRPSWPTRQACDPSLPRAGDLRPVVYAPDWPFKGVPQRVPRDAGTAPCAGRERTSTGSSAHPGVLHLEPHRAMASLRRFAVKEEAFCGPEGNAVGAARSRTEPGTFHTGPEDPAGVPILTVGKRSGCFDHLLPVGRRKLDQLATQRLELRRTIVVLDVVREVRDGIDDAVGRKFAFEDEVAQYAGTL